MLYDSVYDSISQCLFAFISLLKLYNKPHSSSQYIKSKYGFKEMVG